MTAWAVESGGTFDVDAELRMWASGIGEVELEFIKGTVDIRDVARIMAGRVG